MRAPYKTSLPLVFVFLALVILTACGERSTVGEAIPVAGTPASGNGGYSDGSVPSATLHYQYTVDLMPLNVFEDQTIQLFIMVEEANPTLDAVVTGNAEGIQTAKIAGKKGDGICWVTIEHKVNYSVTGFFNPTDCSFEINIDTTIPDSTVVNDECGGTITLSAPSAFYHAPPQGPHRFFKNLDPISKQIDDGVYVIIGLSEVWVPPSTGCGW